MTEKRFDIIVADKVARTIKEEITAIGNASRGTRGFVAQLKAEMQGLASAQGGMGGASTAAVRGMREEAAAATAARSALAAQRQEVEALTRAYQAQANAARSAANAPTGGAGSGSGPRNPAPPRTPRGAGTPNTTGAAANAARDIRQVGEASKLSAQYAAQLGFQLNDIGVSLASGQKPLTVFIQQGAQIAQIPAQAGITWKQFGQQTLNTLGVMKRTGDAALDAAAAQASAAAAAVAAANSQATSNVRVAETEVALATAQQEAAVTAAEQAAANARLTAANEALAASNTEAAVTARAQGAAQATAAEANAAASAASVRGLSGLARAGIIGAAAAALTAAALGSLTKEANNDSGLKTYTKAMGYSAAEVKKLNAVSVGFGDTFKAVFQVGARRIASAFGLSLSDMAAGFGRAMNRMATLARNTMAGTYALVAGTASAMAKVWQAGTTGKSVSLSDLGSSYKDAYGAAQGFMNDVVKQSRSNAKGRQDEMAKGFYDAPRAKKDPKGPKPWDRAQEWKNVNGELDAQIGLLDKYGDELDRANQLEQIAKKFRDHNVPLTAAETAALEAKITKMQEGRRVQEAMTAADEAANGPARKYQATVDALNNMLDKGKLNHEQYVEQMRMAERAYEDATDPLAKFNRELALNGRMIAEIGRGKDIRAYIQQMADAAEAQGKSIYQQGNSGEAANGDLVVNGSRKLTPEAQGLADKYAQQLNQRDYQQFFDANDSRQRYQDPSNDNYVLDHYKQLYGEIGRLRNKDVIDEAEAARRKQDLDRAYLDARLENTSKILGNLSVLQQSKNREVAAFGKAAAMTQATIDGIAAVQAALRGPPGPPWSYAIAASTGVAAAANVAKIAGIGFMRGGYTGNVPTDAPAGTVHGQEYVFDAAATKRIGVPALDAMRRGTRLNQPGNDNMGGQGQPRVTIIPMPGTYVEEVATSDDHIEMIVHRVGRANGGKWAASDMKKGANSQMGKAMKGSYGLQRADR